MSMKQQIMEKLFAEQPLTNEEILLIGSRLDDNVVPKQEGKKPRRKKTDPIPFKHELQSVSRACGLGKDDFECINNLINTELIQKKEQLKAESEIIEVYEKIGLAKPQNFRLLMYQFVKMKTALEGRDNGVGIRFGGGDFGDLLDFLRGKKP